MPYSANEDLPSSVQARLPIHAQDVYRAAFNSAWDGYRSRAPKQREEIAGRIAWAAVKRRYRKEGHDRVPTAVDGAAPIEF